MYENNADLYAGTNTNRFRQQQKHYEINKIINMISCDYENY